MDRVFGTFNRPLDLQALLKTNEISPEVQSHLSKVYATLTLCVFCAIFGVLAHLQYHIGGVLSGIATIGLLFLLAADREGSVPKRLALLGCFGFFQGASLGELINYALHVDPSILVTAFLATTVVFVSFTLSSMLSRRRSWLFLGGYLSSICLFMCVLSLVNLFFRSPLAFEFNLYVGLFVFCGYIVYDTQLIIEKASIGSTDFVWDALELFIDFVAVFVRVLIILLRNQEKDKRKSNSGNR
jgi:FtsH-binding integral membrane protein